MCPGTVIFLLPGYPDMNKFFTKSLVLAAFFILFSIFAYTLLSQSLWDSDFWWHISTGRYIAETGSLPDTDPFSFTSEFEENKNPAPVRESFFLRQYWLAQVILYAVYSYANAKGIIILRTCLVITFLLAILLGLYKRNVKFYISYALIFLAFLSTVPFTGERPVLFTILFSVIAFLLLDDFVRNKGRKIYFLPLIMLLWSNMHGGFILGNLIILVFMLGESLNIIFKRDGLTRKELIVFYLIGILSVAASYFNPNGFKAFLVVLSPEYKHFTIDIQEYKPTFFMFKSKLVPIDWGYISMVLLFPVILIRVNKISFTYLILLPGLLFMSITALRFTVYYSAMATVILGGELNLLIEKVLYKKISTEQGQKIALGMSLAVFLFTAGYFVNSVQFKRFEFKHSSAYSVPKGGVDFIEENKLPGNIYNSFLIGGYLTWRLYPWKKNFTDTRTLNFTVRFEQSVIEHALYSMNLPDGPAAGAEIRGKVPLWEKLLKFYDINLIFVIPLDVYGDVPELIFKLAENDNWVPIYTDILSIIFIRNTEDNNDIIQKFRRTREEVYNTVLLQGALRASHDKINPRYLISAGAALYKPGRLDDALTAYRYAEKRLSSYPGIQEKIKDIETELKEKNEDKRS